MNTCSCFSIFRALIVFDVVKGGEESRITTYGIKESQHAVYVFSTSAILLLGF